MGVVVTAADVQIRPSTCENLLIQIRTRSPPMLAARDKLAARYVYSASSFDSTIQYPTRHASAADPIANVQALIGFSRRVHAERTAGVEGWSVTPPAGRRTGGYPCADLTGASPRSVKRKSR